MEVGGVSSIDSFVIKECCQYPTDSTDCYASVWVGPMFQLNSNEKGMRILPFICEVCIGARKVC